VRCGEREVRAKVAVSRRLTPGCARMHAGTPGLAPGQSGYHIVTLERTDAAVPVAGGAH